jgi:hypothetical protein
MVCTDFLEMVRTDFYETISLQEVCASAKKLKGKKVSAGDSINNEIIKFAVTVLAPYFVKLFNS